MQPLNQIVMRMARLAYILVGSGDCHSTFSRGRRFLDLTDKLFSMHGVNV
jgi:hypothetical protein